MPLPHFGHLAQARPGDLFASRAELALLGQHRPLRTGVCGTALHGVESLILADQYEDDEIHDDYFWYAGHGGRDGKTGHQVAHQLPTPRNRAFMRSKALGRPVRVFRRVAAGGAAQFRYEGLWRVLAHTYGPGQSGFRVYRFRLEPWRG